MTYQPTTMQKRILAILCAATLSLGSAQFASASSAEEFLKSLEGKYSGKGVARILGNDEENIACRITNSFNAATNRLVLAGNCASTKGKNSITGSVKLTGDQLKGTFVAPRDGVSVTRSSGSISGGNLVLNASLFDSKVSELTEIRQIVKKSAKGFNVTFLVQDKKSGKYSQAGTISFSKR